MAKAEFQISRKMIDWIAENEGVTVNDLAERLMPKKQDKFLNGIVSKGIAEHLVKLGKIPFGYLFLQTPPEPKSGQIPDFRQTINATPLTKDFYDTLYDIEYKQSWYKDYLSEIGNDSKLEFVGKFKYHRDLSHEKVAIAICTKIGFDIIEELPKLKDSSYFNRLSELIELSGILVFKNGIVGSNTRRALNVHEFRGFAIADKIAPIIFINGNDSFSAQVFTLCHELAHIWMGETGVSNWSYERDIESFCNKVAAEILMPSSEFKKHWNSKELPDIDKIEALSSHFKVSKYATVIKALTLNLVTKDILETVKGYFINKVKKDGSGGNFYNSLPLRNSNKLTNIIVSYAIAQKLPLREAGNLLNVKADTVIDFYKYTRKL